MPPYAQITNHYQTKRLALSKFEGMRKWLFIILLAGFAADSRAQTDSGAVYLRFPAIPPFSITKVSDSTRFTKADLAKKKATLLFIFSPDCEHCQQETRALIANIDLFKKVQIVMASPLEHHYLKKFYEEYKIAEHPNIIMGRDPAYFLGSFYNIHSFPALFLYDKKGNLIKAFDGSIPVKQIADAL